MRTEWTGGSSSRARRPRRWAGFAQPTCAQTSARPGVKRLAIFHPTDPPEEITSNANRGYKAYFDELKKHGHTEGQNLVVERYSALGHPDRIGDLAREIVANHPDVVLPLSGVFLKEFMALHSFIPMVGPTADPVAFGVASNLARPDKQFTGVVLDAGLEIWPKRFQLLLETARKMTRLGFLNANPLAWGKGWGAESDLVSTWTLIMSAPASMNDGTRVAGSLTIRWTCSGLVVTALIAATRAGKKRRVGTK